MAHAHALEQFTADIALSCLDAFHRLPGLLLVSLHADEDARAFAVGRQKDLGDVAERNTRITEFTLDDRADLLFQGLAYTFPVILFPTLLRHYQVTRRKPMRISDLHTILIAPVS